MISMTSNKKAPRVTNVSATLLIVGCFISVSFTGCTTMSRSLFFDGVDAKPSPPTTRVRRDLLREIDELQRDLEETQVALENAKNIANKKITEAPVPDAELAKSWSELKEILPKVRSGKVDWIAALQNDVIEPRVGLDPATPAQAVFDLDIQISRSQSTVLGDPKSLAVTYRHGTHTQWLTCNNCHPAIFPLELGASNNERAPQRETITMAKIKQGEFCGACHGTVAFGVENACERCHQGLASQADWHSSEVSRNPVEQAPNWDAAIKLLPVKYDIPDWTQAVADKVIAPRGAIASDASDPGSVFEMDLKLVPRNFPAMEVLFPHGSHTQWLTCDNCHSGIFKMQKGANNMSMDKILGGEFCGACHGRVAFPLEECSRCHTILAGGE